MKKCLLLLFLLLSTCSTVIPVEEDTPWKPSPQTGCASKFIYVNRIPSRSEYYYGAINEACKDFSRTYGISLQEIQKELGRIRAEIHVYVEPNNTCASRFHSGIDTCSLAYRRIRYISYINYLRPDSYDVTYHEVMHILFWVFDFDIHHHTELLNKRLCSSRTKQNTHYCGFVKENR